MKNKFSPDWVSPPGETIQDILDERSKSLEDLQELKRAIGVPVSRSDTVLAVLIRMRGKKNLH